MNRLCRNATYRRCWHRQHDSWLLLSSWFSSGEQPRRWQSELIPLWTDSGCPFLRLLHLVMQAKHFGNETNRISLVFRLMDHPGGKSVGHIVNTYHFRVTDDLVGRLKSSGANGNRKFNKNRSSSSLDIPTKVPTQQNHH